MGGPANPGHVGVFPVPMSKINGIWASVGLGQYPNNFYNKPQSMRHTYTFLEHLWPEY